MYCMIGVTDMISTPFKPNVLCVALWSARSSFEKLWCSGSAIQEAISILIWSSNLPAEWKWRRSSKELCDLAQIWKKKGIHIQFMCRQSCLRTKCFVKHQMYIKRQNISNKEIASLNYVNHNIFNLYDWANRIISLEGQLTHSDLALLLW